METKYCATCQRTFPATAAYFHHHIGRRDGWHDECRTCRSNKRKAATEKQRQADERTTIRRLAKLIREGHEVPEPEVIITVAYRHFGGAAGVARAMKGVFDDAKSPRMAKAGILTAICRLELAADEVRRRQSEEHQRQLNGMSREELDVHVARLEKLWVEAMKAEMYGVEGG